MDNSLIEKAQAIRVKSKHAQPVTEDEIALAVAIIMGEVTTAQARKALALGNGENLYSWLYRRLLIASQQGHIVRGKVESNEVGNNFVQESV